MTKEQKLSAAIIAVVAIGVIYLFSRHTGTTVGAATANPANNPLPMVAPYTPEPSTFVLPGGAYIPQNMGGGCGCSIPGVNNATSNFLPASETAFTDLVARSGIDPTQLNMTILAAAQNTDFFPQTSSLAAMAVAGGPTAMPL